MIWDADQELPRCSCCDLIYEVFDIGAGFVVQRTVVVSEEDVHGEKEKQGTKRMRKERREKRKEEKREKMRKEREKE